MIVPYLATTFAETFQERVLNGVTRERVRVNPYPSGNQFELMTPRCHASQCQLCITVAQLRNS
jgi:hypothetical protein